MLITEATTGTKLEALKFIVSFLQTSIEEDKEVALDSVRTLSGYIQQPALKATVAEYLNHQTIRSRLKRIAFPITNHADVTLALESGSTLDALYRLACGTPFYLDDVQIPCHVLRSRDGQPLKAKHGLKIAWRPADLSPKIKSELLARYGQSTRPAGNTKPGS